MPFVGPLASRVLLVHVRAVEDGCLSVRLAGHEQEPGSGNGTVTVSSSPGPSSTSCGGVARRAFAPNAASPSSR